MWFIIYLLLTRFKNKLKKKIKQYPKKLVMTMMCTKKWFWMKDGVKKWKKQINSKENIVITNKKYKKKMRDYFNN